MGFIDYLWELPHIIFKRLPRDNTDIDKLAQGLGPVFDETKDVIFQIRQQSLIITAIGKALDAHGLDRQLPRYNGETDDQYRLRLLAAFNTYTEGGTEAGMIKALRVLGYQYATVYPCYKEKYKWVFLDGSRTLDGSWSIGPQTLDANLEYVYRWFEFVVKLNTGETPTTEEDKKIRAIIDLTKPAEAKLYEINPAVQILTLPGIVLYEWIKS